MAKDSDEDDSDEENLNVPCTAEENDLTGIVQPFSRTPAIVMNIRVCHNSFCYLKMEPAIFLNLHNSSRTGYIVLHVFYSIFHLCAFIILNSSMLLKTGFV